MRGKQHDTPRSIPYASHFRPEDRENALGWYNTGKTSTKQESLGTLRKFGPICVRSACRSKWKQIHTEMPKKPDAWLAYRPPNSRTCLHLFGFTDAGGGASVFGHWLNLYPKHIEVCSVQLPRRESHTNEVPFRSLSFLVEDLLMSYCLC